VFTFANIQRLDNFTQDTRTKQVKLVFRRVGYKYHTSHLRGHTTKAYLRRLKRHDLMLVRGATSVVQVFTSQNGVNIGKRKTEAFILSFLPDKI